MKHCIDCLHFHLRRIRATQNFNPLKARVMGRNAIVEKCERPGVEGWAAPMMERDEGGACGPEGKYYARKD